MSLRSVASILLAAAFCFSGSLRGQQQPSTSSDTMLSNYFRAETEKLSQRCLNDVETVEEWKARKGEYREQLFDMLGLSPRPKKTDLKPVVTGKVEHEEFTVENVHFQSLPQLYVTANLYLPKKVNKPVPAILYLCGHAKVATNGVSFGNKTAYQHHGAWFARNGYACLVVDSVQLGEIEGLHHGTYREKMWWWNSRGYTPAGVEAWNSIRALDYLETRPEIDKKRFGVTGRSGGGAYSWVVTALDDRIKVAAPVAGITDLQNHLFHAVEGHCDCMFHVNTYRWDFPLLAALAAPRPLLLCNTDKDRIFPLDGIIRLHGKVRNIYALHKATNDLGLLITEGPHEDTQDLQVPVFRWFNRFLKKEDPVIEMAATKFFPPHQLKVFKQLPEDELNTLIHDTFVPVAATPGIPGSAPEWRKLREHWMAGLQSKVFAGWPEEVPAAEPNKLLSVTRSGVSLSVHEVVSQENVVLRMYVLQPARQRKPRTVTLEVVDDWGWYRWFSKLGPVFASELTGASADGVRSGKSTAQDFMAFAAELKKRNAAVILFAPRGIAYNAWQGDERKLTHIRRRFMLLGQTADSMRVWDIRRAMQGARAIFSSTDDLRLRAENEMAVNALYASIFEPALHRIELVDMPDSHRNGPDYLNVLRVLDIPQAVGLAADKSPVMLYGQQPANWTWPMATAERLGWKLTVSR